MQSQPELPSPTGDTNADADVCACRVTLLRDAKVVGPDASLVRCALRGELPQRSTRRHKILAVLLDSSGSMAGSMWRRVVEAVASVITDALLADEHVSILLVTYADEAQEVRVPQRSAELQELLLSREHAPKGGTSFEAAFELAYRVVQRELGKLLGAGASPQDVDLAALVFTDGEDTSVKGPVGQYGVRLVDTEASSSAARTAGDKFRAALRGTGCSTHICMAAFGSDHDPGQCQYLSDRYYYINRGETLAEVLAGGLGALLNSAGQCSLRFQLHGGIALEEPLPESLPLDAGGCLDHHVWLRVEDGCTEALSLEVQVAGEVVMRGDASLGASRPTAEGSFEQHLFLVDFVALQLRRVAREICGRRPSQEELSGLRDRLMDAKDRLQLTKDATCVTVGQLQGRAALRERLAEVEAARERLSYALGQFDDRDVNDRRTIGSVAIDAILRDAGQHVPQGPLAAVLARRVDTAKALPAPEALSAYGADFTMDAFSCCNAQELAAQGDALFFQLGGVRPAPGGGFFGVEDGDGFIGNEAFVFLSCGGKQGVKCPSTEQSFTHLGLPLYITKGHFLRAHLLLPDVLRRLTSDGSFETGVTERQLLSLLGRSLCKGPAKSERQIVALMHKARAVHAVLNDVDAGNGKTLLQVVLAEAVCFAEDASSRAAAQDLYAVAACGLLAEGWEPERFAQLGHALCEECLRRRIAHSLRGSSDAQRLCFAWSLLGRPDGSDEWFHADLPCPDAGELRLDVGGFNPFTAPAELEDLEQNHPGSWAPGAAGAAALLSMLSGKRMDRNPLPSEWGTLRQHLSAWAEVVRELGGIGELWRTLDALMTVEDAAHRAAVDRSVAALRLPQRHRCLQGAFSGAAEVASIATSTCLPDLEGGQPLRHEVASALRRVVERRAALARKYPIAGSDFPRLETHSAEAVREIWGAPAEPLDPALHRKAMLRVWRRTMRARVTTTVKEALADKEYRKRGGKFCFPSPMDTFIRGLHRRTADLHQDWTGRLQRDTAGEEARREAVAEMLLRLRWDDSDDKARAKLSKIVGRIWDGLEGVDASRLPPLSSALWLEDDDEPDVARRAASAGATEEKSSTLVPEPASKAVIGGSVHVSLANKDGAACQAASAAASEAGSSTLVPDSEADGAHPSAQVLEHSPLDSEGDGADSSTQVPEPAAEVASSSVHSSLAGEEEGAGSVELGQEQAPVAAVPAPAAEDVEVAEEDQEQISAPAPPGLECERRTARDGQEYTRSEFLEHYGERRGVAMWSEAGAQGGSGAAASALDEGLQVALEALDTGLRRRMDTFVENARSGTRMKLPLELSAKQRKAVQLWAEMRGIHHKSFGYRGRRRLHLSVAQAQEWGAGVEEHEREDWSDDGLGEWANHDPDAESARGSDD